MRAVLNTPDAVTPTGIGDVEPPAPGPGEALVAVRAFSVNRGELALLASRPAGWRPGQDIAGVVVEAAASGEGPPAGARVVGRVEGAGWAELAAVPAERLAALPEEVSVEQAATLPIAGLTALRALRLGGSVVGRRVLVTGANGALGRFAAELAERSGALVTAVAGHAAEIPAGPYELVLDSVGGTTFNDALKATSPGGTIVILGSSSGEPGSLTVFDFIGHEGVRLVNFMSYASADPDDRDLAVLVDLIRRDLLHPAIAFSADWAELNTAIEGLKEQKISGGKAILRIGA